MWTSLALTSIRKATRLVTTPSGRAATQNAILRNNAARSVVPRFFSSGPFAVDAPDGEHDLQDIVSFDDSITYLVYICWNDSLMLHASLPLWQTRQEESSAWAKRVIDVASISEDADSITEMHHAVFEKQMFAVDGPDGEHDFEDMVSSDVVSLVCAVVFWVAPRFLCMYFLLSYFITYPSCNLNDHSVITSNSFCLHNITSCVNDNLLSGRAPCRRKPYHQLSICFRRPRRSQEDATDERRNSHAYSGANICECQVLMVEYYWDWVWELFDSYFILEKFELLVW